MDLTLTCGLHDPDGGLAWMLDAYLPVVRRLFSRVLVSATPDTYRATARKLRALGCDVAVCRGRGGGYTMRDALRRAEKIAPRAHSLYMDLDRVLHWARTRPAEFARMAKRASRTDWFVGERTPRAYRTHQRALIETEAPANAAVSRALGLRGTRDFLVPCLGLSPAARQIALREPLRRDFSMLARWLLALKRAGIRPVFAAYDGLDWETPDQHREAVKKAGGLRAYRASFDTPEEWAKRRAIAADIVESLKVPR